MRSFKTIAICLCACLLVVSTARAAGDDETSRRAEHARHDRNPAVVIVGSAAKGTWILTKMVAKDVARPVAKTVLLKAAPSATKFLLKTGAKHALPLVVKLSVL